MDAFKASEILRVAMKIEENGERLYRHATTLTGDTETKDLFGFLADEEAKHKKTFEGMLSKAEHYQPPESYPGEYLVYLRAYAGNIVFSPEKVEKELAGITDVDSALEFGIQREIESILYYLESRNLVPDSHRDQIDKIVDEERRHYIKLVDFRKNLKP
jgi:rubrerythrin